MKDSDIQRIGHISRYCDDIQNTIKRFGSDFAIFAEDIDYQNSVSMSLLQIGELVVGLSDEFKDTTRDQIQWGAIRGMRNLFAHRYDSMDVDVIWESATKDVLTLQRFCSLILTGNVAAVEQEESDSGPAMSI